MASEHYRRSYYHTFGAVTLHSWRRFFKSGFARFYLMKVDMRTFDTCFKTKNTFVNMVNRVLSRNRRDYFILSHWIFGLFSCFCDGNSAISNVASRPYFHKCKITLSVKSAVVANWEIFASTIINSRVGYSLQRCRKPHFMC